jgi:hypothetical protein
MPCHDGSHFFGAVLLLRGLCDAQVVEEEVEEELLSHGNQKREEKTNKRTIDPCMCLHAAM